MQILKQSKAGFYKALGDEVRLKIINFLLNSRGCTCICHIADHVKRDQSVVFRHVKILENAGILKTYKNGNFLMCCIRDRRSIKKYL